MTVGTLVAIPKTTIVIEPVGGAEQAQIAPLYRGDIVISWGDGFQMFTADGVPIGSNTVLPIDDIGTGLLQNYSISGGVIPQGSLAPATVLYATFQTNVGLFFESVSSRATVQHQLVNQSSLENGAVVGLGADAAVTWESGGALYTELVDGGDGDAITSPINLGPSTGFHPAMTALPDGGYAVAWETGQYPGESGYSGDFSDLGPEDIAFFNSSGQEVKLDTEPYAYSDPTIAATSNGDVIVVDNYNYTGDGGEIYDSSGNLLNTGFAISPSAPSADPGSSPSVATLSNGDFIVVWTYQGNVYGNIFNGSVTQTEPFQIDNASNSSSVALGTAFDFDPTVAATANGYIVSWDVQWSGGQVAAHPVIDYEAFTGDGAPTPLAGIAPSDFNADGQSSILWQNTNGDVNIWNSTPGSEGFTDQDLGVVPSSWQIAGVGEFSAGGGSDILWRNSDGDTALWNSPNPTSSGFTYQDLGVVPSSWQIAGVGDFNGDGASDILWRNADGDTAIWNSNPTSGGFTFQDLGVVSSDWQIEGVGDFNGDGKSDILWRNTATGDVGIWNSTSGSEGFTFQDLGVVPSSWQIEGVGDFNYSNRDQSDILWRNANGDVEIWNFEANGKVVPQDLGVVSTDWQIEGVGDYNGDGASDILWSNSLSGDTQIWNSTAPPSFSTDLEAFTSHDLGVVGAGWTPNAKLS
jgi:FG-GAP-like repeat